MNQLAPYLLYIKLGLLAVVLILLTFCGYKVNKWRTDSIHMAAVEAQAKADVAQARQVVEQMQARYAASQKASEGFQNELETIRNRPVDRSPVRLCQPRSSVPAAATAAGGSGQAVPAAGVLPGPAGSDLEAGPDIGGDLRDLARQADEVAAQGRAIQGLK